MKKIFLLLLLIASSILMAEEVDKDESNEQQRFHRRIYLKLPLTSVEYHWEFLDRKQFLKGNLTLTFTSEGTSVTETIFSNGKLNSNWKVISENDLKDEKNNTIYFGFVSKKKYWFNKKDSAKIVLKNTYPAKGWGSDFKATLPKGIYVSHSKYITQFSDDLDDTPEELAYITIENWKSLWSLTQKTKKGTGWSGK